MAHRNHVYVTKENGYIAISNLEDGERKDTVYMSLDQAAFLAVQLSASLIELSRGNVQMFTDIEILPDDVPDPVVCANVIRLFTEN